MNSHSIDIFDEAYRYHLVFGIAYDFEFQFLPAQHRLFDKYLTDKAGGKAAAGHGAQFLDIINKAAASTTHRIGRTNHDGIPQLGSDFFGSFHTLGDLTTGHLYAEPVHRFLKSQPVFAADNGVNLNTNHLDVVLFQHTGFR